MNDHASDSSRALQKRLADVLAQIPWTVWQAIVRREPEWNHMEGLLPSYGFGPLATLMMAVGLNDYHLKGKADAVYWPRLEALLLYSPCARSPLELMDRLVPFYEDERDHPRKVETLRAYCTSALARSLWHSSPQRTAVEFLLIRRNLAATLKRPQEEKQIVFAMKCLGLALMMAGESRFDFSPLPIPADSRLRKLTKRLRLATAGQEATRKLWSEILGLIQATQPHLTMIHLDSLLWQIEPLAATDLRSYFDDLGLHGIGAALSRLLNEKT
jgi:DNA-(apurinic or apyrimidinic site) lyase